MCSVILLGSLVSAGAIWEGGRGCFKIAYWEVSQWRRRVSGQQASQGRPIVWQSLHQWPLQAPVTLSGRRESQAMKKVTGSLLVMGWLLASTTQPPQYLSEKEGSLRSIRDKEHFTGQVTCYRGRVVGRDLSHSTFSWLPCYCLAGEGNCRSIGEGEHLPNRLLLVRLPTNPLCLWYWTHLILLGFPFYTGKNELLLVVAYCKIKNQEIWSQSCLLR